MVVSLVKNLVNGLSGKTASKATAAATAASNTANTENNALAQNIYNQNSATLAPYVAQGGAASSYINQLLGLPSTAAAGAANSGLAAYKTASGYDSTLANGQKTITNGAAVSGLLNSGSTLKGLTKYEDDLSSSALTGYLGQLTGQQGTGLSAASAQAGVANNYSANVQNNNSTNATNTGNAALTNANSSSSLISSLLSAGGTLGSSLIKASDDRLKTDIVRLGTRSDGLGAYSWTYVPELWPLYGAGRHQGVMAGEVALLCPEALGPVIEGYATVDYAKLVDA